MNRLTKNILGTNPKSPQAKALKKAVKASFKKVLSEHLEAKKDIGGKNDNPVKQHRA